MLRKIIIGLLLITGLVPLTGNACNVTPAFTYTITNTCGLPIAVSASNTTSGTLSNSYKYWWKVNYALATDTITGKASQTLYLKRGGTNYVKLFVKDSSGCIDSTNANITVNTNAKTILDQNQNYTYEPWWMNCLQFVTDPDSFRISFKSADTLKNLRIFWGDGNSDLTGNNLPPNTSKSHLYANLGVYTLKIVTTNGSCTDTVYGMVYNQRQPTAGMIGPVSGSNRGCVPHTLRIINSSYNISNNTKFFIEWGNGDQETKPYTALKDTFYHTYRKGVCQGVIKITASNVCGSSFSTWNPIDISEKDKAKWAMTSTCIPTGNYIFQNLSTDRYCLLPDIKEYYWDFGDGSTVGWTGSKANQSHNFKNEGDYTVKLITKNACGYDTFSNIVKVYYNPIVGYSYDKNRGCKPLVVKLIDTSKGRGITRKWTVVDGTTTKIFTDSILNYTFTNPGNNSVNLSVSNQCSTVAISRPFIVTDKPKARFDTISNRCIPVVVPFNNTSFSYFNNAKYTWHFGDGTTSNQKNPGTKIYNTAGTYTVKLYVADSCGVDSMIRTFTAFTRPKSILSGDTVGCSYDLSTFYNTSTGSNDFLWLWGDYNLNTRSDTGMLKHMYETPANFNVLLIATNTSGCKDTASLKIRIKAGAKANFTFNHPYACAPARFKITNTTAYGKDYKWYANNQLVSTGPSIPDSLITTDTTRIRIKLFVTSLSTCRPDSIEKVYFTPKNPTAVVSNRDSGCGPLTVVFNNASTHTYRSLWNFGNGSTSNLKNPTVIFSPALSNDSNYSVKLNVQNWLGCADSTNTTIKVFPKPSAIFSLSDTAGCGPKFIRFTNTSKTNNSNTFNSLIHRWNFGDGSSDTAAFPTHTFKPNNSKDTVYHIQLLATTINGCADSIKKTIKVFPRPSIRFTPDQYSGCALLNVNFLNQSLPKDTGSINIMSFRWNSGNGSTATTQNFSAVYAASPYGDTVYQATLIGATEHGCLDTLVKNITVHPNPVAQFNVSAPSFCTPVKLSTINTSVSRDPSGLNHIWNFGNGYQSYFTNDSTTFINTTNNDKSYTITYQAISQYNCRDTATYTFNVHPKPIAKFGISSTKLCAPATVNVSDSSINAHTYYWGEGRNFIGNQTSQILRLPGIKVYDTNYIIAHAVQSDKGCLSDTVYKSVLTIGRPYAEFSYSKDSACMREALSLINNSLGSARFKWDFGDNTSSTTVHPKHLYTNTNGNGRDTTFNIRLIATSSAGCKDTFSKKITLVSPANNGIFLSQTIGCSDLKVTLQNRSTAFPAVWWDFGDNTTPGYGDTVSHVFINNIGNASFQPKIRLYRQKYNCRDTVNASVLVYPRPIADFRVNRADPCNDGTHQFISSSKYHSALTWLVDNTTISGYNSFNYQLSSSNYYDTMYAVRLKADNLYGCSDTMDQVVRVKPKTLVQFNNTPVSTCENTSVNFTNTSTNAKRYMWKFGDGFTSNDVNPSHAYARFGNYTVTLFGYDRDGCVDSSKGNMTILELPKADFAFLPGLPKLPNAVVNFTAKPTTLSSNIDSLKYLWDFGDGSPSNNNNQVKNPSHTYTGAGTIEVKLIITNKTCQSSVAKYLYIEDAKPIANFIADTTKGCVPLRVNFDNTSQYGTSYRWVFGDGSPDSYEIEPTHVFNIPGNWDVTLVATGPGGIGSITKQYLITTYPKPILDFNTNKPILSLPNAVFKMQNNSNSVLNNWDVFDSTGAIVQSSIQRDASFNINHIGRFDVRLIGTNTYGCADTLLKPAFITAIGQGYVYLPNAFSPNSIAQNRLFMPSLYNVMESNYTFRVFNRWGEMVYETHDINGHWDGKFNGKLCEQDVYIYTVNGSYYNEEQFSFRGTVTLLR